MKMSFKILGLSVLCLSCASPRMARADVFYWENAAGDMSVTYPDTWRPSNNQSAGDILTVYGAGAHEYATCRVNDQKEGRFKIYPIDFSRPIQHLHFSQKYWDDYFAQYKDPVVTTMRDDAGLGSGFASMAEVSYETAQGARMMRRGIAFVSFYNNHVYTVECSAEASAYEKWRDSFLSFAKSVDFKPHTNYAITGYYRDFDEDKTLKISGRTVLDDQYR